MAPGQVRDPLSIDVFHLRKGLYFTQPLGRLVATAAAQNRVSFRHSARDL
jgi:hypothetical protein